MSIFEHVADNVVNMVLLREKKFTVLYLMNRYHLSLKVACRACEKLETHPQIRKKYDIRCRKCKKFLFYGLVQDISGTISCNTCDFTVDMNDIMNTQYVQI